jgi:hypothetical protein
MAMYASLWFVDTRCGNAAICDAMRCDVLPCERGRCNSMLGSNELILFCEPALGLEEGSQLHSESRAVTAVQIYAVWDFGCPWGPSFKTQHL